MQRESSDSSGEIGPISPELFFSLSLLACRPVGFNPELSEPVGLNVAVTVRGREQEPSPRDLLPTSTS